MALNELAMVAAASNYIPRGTAGVVTLTSGQAAGTDPVVGQLITGGRSAVKIVPPADCKMAITASATAGIPLYGGVENKFVGSSCPTNPLYIIGLSAGALVLVWEA